MNWRQSLTICASRLKVMRMKMPKVNPGQVAKKAVSYFTAFLKNKKLTSDDVIRRQKAIRKQIWKQGNVDIAAGQFHLKKGLILNFAVTPARRIIGRKIKTNRRFRKLKPYLYRKSKKSRKNH